MHLRKGFLFVYLLLSLLMVVFAIQATRVTAEPSFYDSSCNSCHGPTRTCDGCHMHRGNITASADQDDYEPGAPVTITLRGGREGGWIGAFLFDEGGAEIDHVSGSGFPIDLHASAPMEAGEYQWSAAWRGNNNGSGHLNIARTVTVVVTQPPASVEEDSPPSVSGTWGRIKSRYRR